MKPRTDADAAGHDQERAQPTPADARRPRAGIVEQELADDGSVPDKQIDRWTGEGGAWRSNAEAP